MQTRGRASWAVWRYKDHVRTRVTLIGLVWVLGSLPAHAQTESHPVPQQDANARQGALDLPEALVAARANYPSLEAADQAIRAAQARLTEASLSPYFQFRGTAGFGLAPEAFGTPIFSRDSQLPVDNPWRPTVQVGISGVVPLYTFGLLPAARAAADAGLAAARQDRIRRSAQLAYDVRRAYLGLQLALDVRQMIAEGSRHLRRAQRELQERLEDGEEDVDETDVYRLASAEAEISVRSSEAQALEAISREALALLTGIEAPTIPECPIQVVAVEIREVAPLLEAGDSSADAAMLDALVRARDAGVRASRASLLPAFGVGLSASQAHSPGITDQTNPFVHDPGNRTGFTAGLLASWSLDVPGGLARLRRSQAEASRARAQRSEALLGIRLRTMTAFHQLEDAIRRVAAWGGAERSTRQWFVATAQAYQLGTSDADDLIDAISAYFEARYNALQATHDHNLGVARLERVTGLPLTEDQDWSAHCE